MVTSFFFFLTGFEEERKGCCLWRGCGWDEIWVESESFSQKVSFDLIPNSNDFVQ